MTTCSRCGEGHALSDPETGELIRWCRCGLLDTPSVGALVCRCEDAPCCGCHSDVVMMMIREGP